MRTLVLYLLMGTLCIVSESLQAQTIRSSSTMIGAGGGFSGSPQFLMNSAIGQPESGTSSSPIFHQSVGFISQTGNGGPHVPMFSYSNGWNLVSLPLKSPNLAKTFIYPTASSGAFAYYGSYQQRDTLQIGVGYWLKFTGSQLLPLQGSPVSNDTIQMSANWNLIGAISTPVNIENIIQLPANLISSNYFGYNNGYTITQTIEPGKGYWVKTTGAGSIILKSGGSFSTEPKPSIVEELNTKKMNSITFEELDVKMASKANHILFLGSTSEKGENQSNYEMPPTPPWDIFDIRFSSNRFVEFLPEEIKTQADIPLRIQTNEGTLKITLKTNDNLDRKYSLVERLGKKIEHTYKLEPDRSITIKHDNEKSYAIHIEIIPTEYQLYQNYPNPFNPSTEVQYQLPRSGWVTLKIYNAIGQEVGILVNGEVEAGYHSIEFNGVSYPSGMYFYKIIAGSFSSVKKMLMIK